MSDSIETMSVGCYNKYIWIWIYRHRYIICIKVKKREMSHSNLKVITAETETIE